MCTDVYISSRVILSDYSSVHLSEIPNSYARLRERAYIIKLDWNKVLFKIDLMF